MNEFTPRPHLPVSQLVETPPPPDYSRVSSRQLRRAEALHSTRLLTADFGHVLLKSVIFTRQVYDFLSGHDVEIEWDPDVTGLRPDLDEKHRRALEHLDAIWQEKHLRRSVRQGLRDRHTR
jgi:hypothetical protein